MSTRLGPWFAAVGLVMAALSPVAAQNQDKPTIKQVPARAISPVDGKENYQEYCAVCHGKEGKGDGPAARALKTPPADLTTIAKRRDGKFPSLAVIEIIEGKPDLPAHGAREMPMWGSVFRGISAGAGDKSPELRVRNLVRYLESLQVK